MKSLLLPIFWSFLFISVESFREQWVKVTGQFLCDGYPYEGVEIELYDRDKYDPDDLLSFTRSDSTGNYSIHGVERGLLTIVPYLKVYHYCRDTRQRQNCAQTYITEIPQSVITFGSSPKIVYVMDPLDLIYDQPGQTCDSSRPEPYRY